jgi:hypothetical protein
VRIQTSGIDAAAAIVLCLVLPFAAFGQGECPAGEICFEPGEAPLERPDDIGTFVLAQHEKLGLTGREVFRCTRVQVIREDFSPRPLPDYEYHCQQPFVQGVPAKYLSMRIHFWDRNQGVRYVRCRCVREDVVLPRPTIGERQAVQRGLRYIYARFPEVPQESIAVVEAQGPVVQWDLSGESSDGFRLARNTLYHFPLFVPRLGRTIHGELTVSIDALDESVIRAVDEKQNLYRWGILVDSMERFYGLLASMPPGEERFDASQRFRAFQDRGEGEIEVIEEHLSSLARWEPDGSSRYIAYFADATGAEQLAAFLDDNEASLLSASFWYTHEEQWREGSITAAANGGDVADTAIRAAFDAELARPGASAHLPGLVDIDEVEFKTVEFQMRHVDALRLYETERGSRILTLRPQDRFANDQFLDIL